MTSWVPASAGTTWCAARLGNARNTEPRPAGFARNQKPRRHAEVFSINDVLLDDGHVRNAVNFSDTVPVPLAKRVPKLTVLSIAPLLGEAISRIYSGRSVGELFEETYDLGELF